MPVGGGQLGTPNMEAGRWHCFIPPEGSNACRVKHAVADGYTRPPLSRCEVPACPYPPPYYLTRRGLCQPDKSQDTTPLGNRLPTSCQTHIQAGSSALFHSSNLPSANMKYLPTHRQALANTSPFLQLLAAPQRAVLI